MDSIQTYAGSDSDSDSDYDSERFSTKQDSCVQVEESETKLNFFGLETSSQTSKLSSNIKDKINKNEGIDSKDINTDSSLIVPDGDFWKGFAPDPNDTEIQDFDNGLEYESIAKERIPENMPGINHRKRSNTSEHTSKNVAIKKQMCSSFEGSARDKHSQQEEIRQEEKRKIFYVHSRVTPYLASHHICKCASKPSSSWRAHNQTINRLLWNKSNFSHLILTAGMDSLVKVWNVWSSLDHCVSTISHHTKAVRNALWGIQGRSIISCSYDKFAIVTDVESGAIQSRHTHPGFVVACCLHPNNPNCFATGSENLIQFWDVRTPLAPTKVLTYKGDMGQPQDLLFIQSGNELISCSDVVSQDSSDRTIMAWDVRSGNVISNQIYQEKYTCTRLKRGPSDSKFLAQTQGGYVALFSTTRPYKMDKHKRFEGHKMHGYNIGFDVSHDGTLVYSGSAEGGIHCYDYRSGRLIKKCANDLNDVITDVACHPVLSTLVASCTWGGSLALWH